MAATISLVQIQENNFARNYPGKQQKVRDKGLLTDCKFLFLGQQNIHALQITPSGDQRGGCHHLEITPHLTLLSISVNLSHRFDPRIGDDGRNETPHRGEISCGGGSPAGVMPIVLGARC